MSIKEDLRNIKSKARNALNQAWDGLGDYVVGYDSGVSSAGGTAANVSHSRADGTQAAAKDLEAQFVHFLVSHQCKWERKVDEHKSELVRYFFDYQDGHFIAVFYNKKVFELMYLHFHEVESEYIDHARTICNHYNNVCIYNKLFYSTDEESNTVRLHMSMLCDKVDESLNERLRSFFSIQRDFVDELSTYSKQSADADVVDLELAGFNSLRERTLMREFEMKHQHIEVKSEAVSFGYTLEELLRLLTRNDRLSVTAAQIVNSAHESYAVESPGTFDVRQVLIDTPPGEAPVFKSDSAVAVVWYTMHPEPSQASEGEGKEDQANRQEQPRMASILFTAEDEIDKTLYYRASMTLQGEMIGRSHCIDANNDIQEPVSVLLGFDNKPDKVKKQEAEYMWQDALLKQKNKEPLSDDERLLCHIDMPDMALSVYWGRQLMRKEHYAQALKHLLNAYNAIHTMLWCLSKKQREKLIEVYYYIGVCYLQLGEYDRAFFFADQLRGSGDIEHCKLIVNVLTLAHDMRAFPVIESMLKALYDNKPEDVDEDEDMPSHIVDFVHFLRLRRAYALVDFHRYDEAEEELKEMLNDKKLHGAAIDELAHIKRIKEEEQEMNNAESYMIDLAKTRQTKSPGDATEETHNDNNNDNETK